MTYRAAPKTDVHAVGAHGARQVARISSQPNPRPAEGARYSPFDKGPVKIALVQYSGAGDYFEQWTKGARQQADSIGFEMQLHDAQADDATSGCCG